MFVYYITMQWPARSETFAVSDIRALMAQPDMRIRVAGMRSLGQRVRQALTFMGVDDIPALHLGRGNYVCGILQAIGAPLKTLRLIRDMWREEKRWPIRLKSLALIPSAFTIYHDIQKVKPDVVHLFWGHYPCLVARLLQQDINHPRISMALGAYDLRMQYGLTRLITKAPDVIMMTYAQANTEIISAFTGCQTERIKTIYHGVSALPPMNIRESLGIPLRLAFTGRLIVAKGVYELIDIARGLSHAGLAFHMDIIGDGPELENIKKQATSYGVADHITFRGWLAHHDVMAVMHQSDFFLFPSHEECIPNVVKEAMASGCLPIVSPTWAIAELVDHGQNGWITTDFRPDTFICTILEAVDICTDVPVYKQMQDSGRQKVEDKFSCAHNVKLYLQAWG